MYKDTYTHYGKCIECQAHILQRHAIPVREMDATCYPFEKVGIDTVGPFPESHRGNKYIITMVDWYSGWPEAFAVPNKSAETIGQLLLNEIFPRHGCPRVIVSDNGTEFVNYVMTNICHELNIQHVTTSPYHPEANGKTERFHRVMNEMLAKQAKDRIEDWDLCLPQVLAASRVGISDSTQHSPFYLLYTRDPVLPLDNLLKPRRRYQGEDFHRYALERQHAAFMKAKICLRRARALAKRSKDKTAKDDQFKVGDPVFVWNAAKKNKLDTKWRSHYRITEQASRDTFWVKNQLTGNLKKIHAKNLGRAKLEEWPTPDPDLTKRSRATKFVVAPAASPVTSDTESDDTRNSRKKPNRRAERRRQPRPVGTNSDQSDSRRSNQSSDQGSIVPTIDSLDDQIISDGDPSVGDPEPSRNGTGMSDVSPEGDQVGPASQTDSEDITLAQLRETPEE